ncbi:hypothetical protein DL93DRAFT_2166086 [Clavulina sp. PMI_390]|nr:hypothetical protein DL93DRAFT_2166086 [Clavulina sp. PMI_390]
MCAAEPTVQIQPPSSVPSNNVIQDNFAGISMELTTLGHLIGSSPSNIAAPMVNYLKNIRSRMSSPFRLHIGGKSLDGSFYDPYAAQMISSDIINVDKGVKTLSVTYGPQVLSTLKRLSSDVGGIYHLLGLSLAHHYNSSNVIKFTQDAQEVLGSSLDSFITGNEPDSYKETLQRPKNYSVFDYAREMNNLNDALRQSVVTADLSGPSLCSCSPKNVADVLGATLNTDSTTHFKYVLLQHYPYERLKLTSYQLFTESLLQQVRDLVSNYQIEGVLMARKAGTQVIVNKFNTPSCGGEPGGSDTFAAAIWTIDYVLSTAAHNYSAAYLHIREPGAPHAMFTYPNTSLPNGSWETVPQYYSLLLLTEALSTIDSLSLGSVVVDLNLPDPATIWGYAIYGSSSLDGPPRTLVLSNSGPSTVTFSIPPSLATSTTLATVSVDGNGVMQGVRSQTYLDCQMGCILRVPGPSVVLVIL